MLRKIHPKDKTYSRAEECQKYSLGLMKNFVKAIIRDGAEFLYLEEKFPEISDAKIKEGIFIDRQVRQLMRDEIFNEKLNCLEQSV